MSRGVTYEHESPSSEFSDADRNDKVEVMISVAEPESVRSEESRVAVALSEVLVVRE